MLVGLNYDKKEAIFLGEFIPTGNYDEDIIKIKSKFEGMIGKHPKNFIL